MPVEVAAVATPAPAQIQATMGINAGKIPALCWRISHLLIGVLA